jgi:hypothetical protein
MTDQPSPWTCHARPASLGGRTCGHLNERGRRARSGELCCEACGATQRAGELRLERSDVDGQAVRR